ncbi:MAG: HEAT repeat domain-containing protein [Myxococcota bacterium]
MSHPVLAQLARSEPAERADACRRAARDPAAVLLVDALAGALGDPVPAVAQAASDALAELGAQSDATRAALRRALHGERANARWAAAFALFRLSPPDSGLLPPLVEAWTCSAGDVRWRAARLLVQCEALLPEVRPLVRGLAAGDPRPEVRRMAIHCVGKIDPDDREMRRTLLLAAGDAVPAARRAAVAALAALPAAEPEVYERLRAIAASDPDPGCRRLAARALAAFESETGLPRTRGSAA